MRPFGGESRGLVRGLRVQPAAGPVDAVVGQAEVALRAQHVRLRRGDSGNHFGRLIEVSPRNVHLRGCQIQPAQSHSDRLSPHAPSEHSKTQGHICVRSPVLGFHRKMRRIATCQSMDERRANRWIVLGHTAHLALECTKKGTTCCPAKVNGR